MPLALLVALFLPPPRNPATAATVWVRAGDRATGTGWVVDGDRRWVVTARHILGDRTDAQLAFYTPFAGGSINDRDLRLRHSPVFQALDRITTAKVVATSANADLILLQADRLPADIPALELGDDRPVGTECHAVGHRHDAPMLWVRTDGFVRQAGRLTDGYFWAGRKLGVGTNVLFAHLPVELGDSGAAVVDPAGRVVGVVSAFSERTPGLAILTGADEVRRFVAEARGDKKQPPAAVARTPDLLRSTVWVRPTATDGRFAGVLIDLGGGLVLTSATAVGPEDVTDVVFPVFDEEEICLAAEATAYADRLGLYLSGHQVRGVVLARDAARDLALLELSSIPNAAVRAAVAPTGPRVGAAVTAVSHPPGIELMWLSARGSVRGTGNILLQRQPPADAVKVTSLLLQLPHQGTAAGGPVVNDRGELVGILAGREPGRHELAFAAGTAEVRAFLESARPLTQPKTAAEWHHRGTYLRDRADRRSSITSFHRAATLAPKDADFQAAYALAAAEDGPDEPFRPILSRLEAFPNRSADVDATLAAAYLAVGRKEDALRAADRAVLSNPKQPLARVVKTACLPPADAIRLLDQTVADEPAFARAYRARAELLRREDGTRERALADATRAVELAPYDARARLLRAEILGEMKEWKKAGREYVRLTEDRPGNGPLRAHLARSYLNAGEDGRAVETLGDLVRLGPTAQKAAFTIIRTHGDDLLREDRGLPGRTLEWQLRALKAIGPLLPSLEGRQVEELIQSAGKRTAPEDVRRIGKELARWEK